MKILAVDSVGKTIETSLITDEKIVTKTLDIDKNASEFLLSMIDELLSCQDVELKDLDYLALNVGPGSFTGIRIAMSLLKGFMVITNLKCIVVNSFDVLSYNINKPKYIVAIDSGTSSFYCKVKDNMITSYMALEMQELKDLSKEYLIFSDVELDSEIPHTILKKEENALFESVNIALKNGNIKNEYQLEPLYVKKAQSEREYRQKFLSTICIENATNNDIQEIESLEKENFSNPYTKEQILSDITQNRILVAKENSKVVGYLSYTVSDQVEILKLCVNSDKRELGIGQSLVEKLSFYQKDIFLEVNEHNSAQSFYAKIGFKFVSVRKHYYKDGSDAIIMVKRFC